MALYASSGNTWTLLPSTWSGSGFTWYNFDGTYVSGTHITTTSNALDLGSVKWFYPTSSLITVGTNASSTIVITYATSDDDVTYTTGQVPGAFKSRYVKVEVDIFVTTGYEGLSSLVLEAHFDTKTVNFNALDTSTLGGSTSARTLDLSNDVSNVFSANVTPSASSSDKIASKISNDTPSTFAFSVFDLDSYGKVDIDSTINLTVSGFPALETIASTGEVRVIT
jgi:hypothetical protein